MILRKQKQTYSNIFKLTDSWTFYLEINLFSSVNAKSSTFQICHSGPPIDLRNSHTRYRLSPKAGLWILTSFFPKKSLWSLPTHMGSLLGRGLFKWCFKAFHAGTVSRLYQDSQNIWPQLRRIFPGSAVSDAYQTKGHNGGDNGRQQWPGEYVVICHSCRWNEFFANETAEVFHLFCLGCFDCFFWCNLDGFRAQKKTQALSLS